MAETLTATSPLQGWTEKFAHVPPTVTLSEEPFVAMVDLWADPDGPAASQASAILGLDLPTTPSTYVNNDTLTAIWMGPAGVADHRWGAFSGGVGDNAARCRG